MKRLILTVAIGLMTVLTFAQQKTKLKGQSFGESVENGNIISAMKVGKILGNQAKAELKVQGEVVEVCKKKGCFVKLKTADNQTIFVKFKDYAFFLPKDIEGRQLVIEGLAERKTTSVAELKHYAEDAKKSAEEIAKITEPKNELVFMAKGAVLLDK